MSLGDWLFGLFSGMGLEGVVICIFLLFLIDALLFPTLPELFFVLALGQCPTVWFGGSLLLAAILAELIGIFALYYVVKHIRVPERVSRIAEKYIDFLVVSDERIILVNRVAPMIPFLGAFIAMIKTWRPKVCAFYITLGCILKYGVIALASGFFMNYLGSDQAQTVTLVFIFAIIIISFIASFIKKKRSGLEQ